MFVDNQKESGLSERWLECTKQKPSKARVAKRYRSAYNPVVKYAFCFMPRTWKVVKQPFFLCLSETVSLYTSTYVFHAPLCMRTAARLLGSTPHKVGLNVAVVSWHQLQLGRVSGLCCHFLTGSISWETKDAWHTSTRYSSLVQWTVTKNEVMYFECFPCWTVGTAASQQEKN